MATTRSTTTTKAFSYLRMSTSEQLKGDSLRRQLEQSRAYCETHGLILIEDMRDIGLSAYHGRNVGEGAALGQFLDAIRKKRVEPGSYLLIENWDRVSRQHLLESYGLFLEIIKAGVRVVTLSDGRTYDNSVGLGEMIMTMVSFERSFQESDLKSKRGKALWKNKRAMAGERPVSRVCPAWLRPKADGSGFEPNRDRVRIVRRIFTECADHGMGVSLITKGLNRDGVPVFASKGKRGSWYNSYVQTILRNRAVLGEFQGHERVDGKRRPEGEVQPGYYPAVVSEDLWYRAQAALNKRRIIQDGRVRPVGGRKGEGTANVFQKIISCAGCGSALHLVDRGNKGGRALVCEASTRGAGSCQSSYWTYNSLETSVLTFVREINLSELLSVAAGQPERDEVEKEIRAAEGRLQETMIQRDRAYQLVVESGTEYMKAKLQEHDATVSAVERTIVLLSERHRSLVAESESFAVSREKVTDLVERVRSKDGSESHKLRSTLAAHLRSLIDQIKVSFQPRFFVVKFKSGEARVVAPHPENPTRFIAIAHTKEELITDANVRILLARFGFADPTPEQYEEMASDLFAAARKKAALGDAALRPLEKKWEKRRLGPPCVDEVMAELKKRSQELGLASSISSEPPVDASGGRESRRSLQRPGSRAPRPRRRRRR